MSKNATSKHGTFTKPSCADIRSATGEGYCKLDNDNKYIMSPKTLYTISFLTRKLTPEHGAEDRGAARPRSMLKLSPACYAKQPQLLLTALRTEKVEGRMQTA
jgi:hypothetical protein